jgi:PadR family transcriptional regulator, regulatory protein AphA
MQDVKLTPTSYIVLGLLDIMDEATPYQLKQAVASSIGHFWTLQHAQLYTEPERLVRGGHVTVELEQGGRRRKRYALTESGRKALEAWIAQPTDDLGELREPALLKLFFGADPAQLAPAQLEAHRRKLTEYEAIRDAMPVAVPLGPRKALEAGIRAERGFVAYWEDLAGATDGRAD